MSLNPGLQGASRTDQAQISAWQRTVLGLSMVLFTVEAGLLKLAHKDFDAANLVTSVSHSVFIKGLWIGLIGVAAVVCWDLFKNWRQINLFDHRAAWGVKLLQLGSCSLILLLQECIPAATYKNFWTGLGLGTELQTALTYVVLTSLCLIFALSSALWVRPALYWRRWFKDYGWSAALVFVAGQIYYGLASVWLGFSRFWYELLLEPTLAVAHFWATGLGLHLVPYDKSNYFGTASFVVEVNATCLGYQGVSIFLSVLTTYLLLQRKHVKFPHALLVAPLCVGMLLAFNALRIALLVFVGHHWSAQVAVLGFHSTAGWIELFIVLFIALISLHRGRWFQKNPAALNISAPVWQPYEFWLLPQVLMLAVSFVTTLFTGDFFWAYPIHILAAAAFMLHHRDRLPSLSLSEHWLVPVVAGLAVFLMWIALIPVDVAQSRQFGVAFMDAPIWLSSAWLLLRVCGASLIVPLVEELAFRGFVWHWVEAHLRGRVPGALMTMAALGVSTLAFAMLHADGWAAALAGLIYGAVYARKRSIMAPVMAHGVTNGLLALYVISTGAWSYW